LNPIHRHAFFEQCARAVVVPARHREPQLSHVGSHRLSSPVDTAELYGVYTKNGGGALQKLLAALVIAGAAAYAADIPRLPDGKPDLNGVWERPYVPDMARSARDQQGPGTLPFTTWGAETFKNYDVTKFDYTGHCLPQGLTRSMNSPFPIEIFQTPK